MGQHSAIAIGKQLIQSGARRLGYTVAKLPIADLSRYEEFPVESLAGRRFYNIGAGSFSHAYWTNVDYGTEYYSSVQQPGFIDFDLTSLKPLPIGDDSAEIVYSSHTIEHVDDSAVRNMLSESHRILKKGGLIRLVTPDAELAFRAYRRRDRTFWSWVDKYSAPGTWERHYRRPLREASISSLFLHYHASQVCEIDADDTAVRKYCDREIDEVFSRQPMESALDFFTKQCVFNAERPGNHMNWWTHEKLSSMLRSVGFEDVYRSGYGQSVCRALRDLAVFDKSHAAISL